MRPSRRAYNRGRPGYCYTATRARILRASNAFLPLLRLGDPGLPSRPQKSRQHDGPTARLATLQARSMHVCNSRYAWRAELNPKCRQLYRLPRCAIQYICKCETGRFHASIGTLQPSTPFVFLLPAFRQSYSIASSLYRHVWHAAYVEQPVRAWMVSSASTSEPCWHHWCHHLLVDILPFW